VEKQPTTEELEDARRRARADAEARVAAGDEEDAPGEQPFAYAAETVQAEYARVFEETLERLRKEHS
jgi:hypothetical protein